MADISGYTAFLVGNELEHGQGIIEDLTRCMLAELGPPMKLVKLEGDAAFCCAPDGAFQSAERVLETIERCYCAFSEHKADMQRATTCTCAACANISGLDLKFLAHYGSFVMNAVGGVEDLAGPDVILIHRLLKNTVPERTGCHAYAYLTSAVLDRVGRPLSLQSHSETYESFGEVTGGVEDLAPVLAEMRAARRVFVTPGEATVAADIHVAAPVSVAWECWVNPAFSVQWLPGLTGWKDHPNARGRVGIGAEGHCAHGKGGSIQKYLDFRPFDYLTTESKPTKRTIISNPPAIVTAQFEPQGDGTTVIHFRAEGDRWRATAAVRRAPSHGPDVSTPVPRSRPEAGSAPRRTPSRPCGIGRRSQRTTAYSKLRQNRREQDAVKRDFVPRRSRTVRPAGG